MIVGGGGSCIVGGVSSYGCNGEWWMQMGGNECDNRWWL